MNSRVMLVLNFLLFSLSLTFAGISLAAYLKTGEKNRIEQVENNAPCQVSASLKQMAKVRDALAGYRTGEVVLTPYDDGDLNFIVFPANDSPHLWLPSSIVIER